MKKLVLIICLLLAVGCSTETDVYKPFNCDDALKLNAAYCDSAIVYQVLRFNAMWAGNKKDKDRYADSIYTYWRRSSDLVALGDSLGCEIIPCK